MCAESTRCCEAGRWACRRRAAALGLLLSLEAVLQGWLVQEIVQVAAGTLLR